MKAKKVITLFLTAAMAISTVACGGKSADTATDANANVQASTKTSAAESAPEAETAPAQTEPEADTQQTAPAGEVSIDFEDGVYGFMGVDKSVNPVGDDSTLSVADFGGSKALKVVSNGKTPYVAIQVDALLGDKAAEVKTVEMSLGIENPDGVFNAVSGKIYAFLGAENARKDGDWSVYLESANPKTAVYTLPDEMSFGEGNYMVVSLETDNGKEAGAAPAILYIDNIAFKDASGNVIAADTTAEYVSTTTETDRSNLANITDAVVFEGFAAKGDGWAQSGFAMTEDILAALVPGSVVEISFTSENGDMWIVMNEAEAGWMRVGDGTNGTSAVNDSKTTAQIPFEMLAEYCGDDVSKWGTTMQCEASGAWEVFGVKVGQAAKSYNLTDVVEFDSFTAKGDGWAQDGKDMTEDILAALVPGSVVEVTYTSESGDMWLVIPDAEAGWMRVGDGTNGKAITDGSKAYIPFEMIAEYCGEDVSKWGTRIQCEASGAWEVFSVAVGKDSEVE